MSPFISIQVQPAYGSGHVGITWNLNHGYHNAEVFVYRSISGGLPPWDMLNTAGVSGGVGYFVDRSGGLKRSSGTMPHYRLALRERNGTIHDSPIASALGRLTARQYRDVQDLMWQELRSLRAGNGVPVFIFAPLPGGIPVAGFDAETNQMHSSGAEGYGEYFVGGFGKPALAWAHRFGDMTVEQTPGKDGFDGSSGVRGVNARLTAFPRPAAGYLIVVPDSDERYEIGETIKPLLYRGVYPLGYEVQLLALQRNDERYRLPVPVVPDSMYKTV